MEISVGNWLGNIVVELGAAAVLLVAQVIVERLKALLERSHPRARAATLAFSGILFLTTNVVVMLRWPDKSLTTFVVTALVFISLVWRELKQYWAIGVMSVDAAVSKGLSYKKSLELCRNSLEFLGVGAGKLVNERETFTAAIARCHRDARPIRFLLCNPQSPELIRMAKLAKRPDVEYQQIVGSSLNVLEKLRQEGRNIEIRLYGEMPLFRLMFIDDRLCLASHYVFGEGDGSQLPQMHIRNAEPPSRDVESLYFPFRNYFEQLWQAATPF